MKLLSYSGNDVEFTMWDEVAKSLIKKPLKSYHPQSSLPSAPVELLNTEGIRFTCEAIVTCIKEDRGCNYASCS
nr:hypothetical protein [Tanacetum cinerariifolium]